MIFPLLPGILLGLIFSAGVAVAAPVVAENGTEPADGLVTVSLSELWRAGGEDDDIFFGNLTGIAVDPEGNFALLDRQLSEVHYFSPAGEYLRTIGRAGEGPGEVTRPSGMFIEPDGRVCLTSNGVPGKLVRLNPDGTPAGEWVYSESSDNQSNFSVLSGGFTAPDGMVLIGLRMTFEPPLSKQTFFLARCDQNVLQQKVILEKDYTIDYSQFVMTEMGLDFVWSRFTVDGQGKVYVAPERNGYKIHVYEPGGDLTRVIERPYEPLTRNEKQTAIARKVLEAIGAYYPVPPRQFVVEPLEQDISGLWVNSIGELWVQTSRGNQPEDEGVWCVLDVFDKEGKFARQMALLGSFNALQDALYLFPDARLALVVTGALDAFLNEQAVAQEDPAGSPEQQPMEVICFQLTW